MPSRSVELIVAEADAGERADVVLGRCVDGLSRRQARDLARAGGLTIEGRRRPPSTRVRAGERVCLDLDVGADADAVAAREARLASLAVVGQTAQFLYVLKPAGVHTVALTPGQPGTLATAVAERFPECARASIDPREGGAVHRLDQATSGVVAFARTRSAWEQARAGFSDERVIKHYLAVSAPAGALEWPPPLPEDGLRGWVLPTDEALESPWLPDTPVLDEPTVRVRAALGRGEGRARCAVRLDGNRASTRIRPLARRDDRWLLALALDTGRRHQARVHLSWIGLPIVGDALYGHGLGAGPTNSERTGAPAIHLHAVGIDLSAVLATESAVIAPPPPGFW